MSDDTFQLEKEQVFARSESPQKLFGYTPGELGLMASIGIITQWALGNGKITAAALFAGYLYIRKLKTLLPERFLQNLIKFYLRRHFLYRAGGRDTEWRPPVIA